VNILAMVDERKVDGPFLVSGSHRSIANSSPRTHYSPESKPHPSIDHRNHGTKQECGQELEQQGNTLS